MSFSDNLQNLRKRENMSQETLAGLLDVSRQAVSKWESGNAYPETEKIISICKIFNCSMDQLIMGEISFSSVNDYDFKNSYDSFYNKYSKAMAFGVALILFGVTFLVGVESFFETRNSDYIGVTFLLLCVLIAVPVFIYFGMQGDDLKKKITNMPQIYSEDEIERFKNKYPITVALGVGLILFGVLVLVGSNAVDMLKPYEDANVVFLLACVTIAVYIFVYYGIQKDKYDIEKFNKQESISEKKSSKICGVIMLIATFIFMFLGFVFDLWEICWAAFPLGGIVCAIVSTILAND